MSFRFAKASVLHVPTDVILLGLPGLGHAAAGLLPAPVPVVHHLRHQGAALAGPALPARLAGRGAGTRPRRARLRVAHQLKYSNITTYLLEDKTPSKVFLYLFECLLILSVLECVDEWVDGGGHPSQDGGHHVQSGKLHLDQKISYRALLLGPSNSSQTSWKSYISSRMN